MVSGRNVLWVKAILAGTSKIVPVSCSARTGCPSASVNDTEALADAEGTVPVILAVSPGAEVAAPVFVSKETT